jgi:outer membrane protein OmpA-like peptidoglycan-associated protein
VVLENLVRPDTLGRTSVATLQYEIVPRGAYIAEAGVAYALPQPGRGEPPDVQQARNAVAIAQIAQASRYAPEGLATALQLLAQTEQLVVSRGPSRDIISQSRAAVQAAEGARLQAVNRRRGEEAEAARAAAARREKAAMEAAAAEAAARRFAEDERRRAEQAASEAERDRRSAEQAASEAERARRHAERERREAEAARLHAQSEAALADDLLAQADRDRAALRATLRRQLNEILETRDTARGLIVSVGDVLFETGQYTLRPVARERLARVAGIVQAHPGLTVQAEGYTDSTGAAAANERLSQQRADAVGAFLVAQGLPPGRVTTRGFGAASPIASNETPEGRQKNRRVEIVVWGEVIGVPIDGAHP